ncbi:MAG: lysylphosphatidylglycerol synthase domain-containing protein [Alphaproteobacteria bacterium]
MKLGRVLIAAIGLAVATYLILEEGIGEVFRALSVAGWGGLGTITLFHVLPTVLCGIAWWLVMRRHSSEGWFVFTWVRWIRDGIDGVVPILPVSGELVGTRILAQRGMAFAGASIIVDLTGELLSQVLFAVMGFILLVASHPEAPYKLWIGVGIAAMALQFTGFLVAQKMGLFRLIERPLDWLMRRKRLPESDVERTLHDRILALYEDGPAFAGCIILHFVAWIVGGLEAWIALDFMGHPLSVAEVLAIEGIVYAIRSVTFFIPLGAGVQEGGYILVGSLVGLPPDLALALSLMKRGRDLLVGTPALLFWQLIEGYHFRRRARRNDLPA